MRERQGECQQRERDGLKYDKRPSRMTSKSVDVETFQECQTPLRMTRCLRLPQSPKNVKVPKIANKNIKPAEMTQTNGCQGDGDVHKL